RQPERLSLGAAASDRAADIAMKSEVRSLAPVASGSVIAPVTPSGGPGLSDSRTARDAERASRYRLVIEQEPEAGVYVYKTLDRITGEVVSQLPREEVVRMRQDPGYAAGKVISTKA